MCQVCNQAQEQAMFNDIYRRIEKLEKPVAPEPQFDPYHTCGQLNHPMGCACDLAKPEMPKPSAEAGIKLSKAVEKRIVKIIEKISGCCDPESATDLRSLCELAIRQDREGR